MLRLILQTCVLIAVLLLNAGVAKSELCSGDFIPCDDGNCVLRKDWCDGEKTCEDGSDEAYCKKSGWFTVNPNKCKGTHFDCSDGPCWPKAIRCDGYEDCKDASDEEFCGLEEDETETSTQTTLETTLSDSSEEDESDETDLETTEAKLPTTISDSDEYKDDYDETADQTTTVSPETTSISQTTRKSLAKALNLDWNSHVLPNASIWTPTPPTEDYYGRKMKNIEGNHQYSTSTWRGYVPHEYSRSTSDYRTPYSRQASPRPTSQFSVQYPTSRRPANIPVPTRHSQNQGYSAVPYHSPISTLHRNSYPVERRHHTQNNNLGAYNAYNNAIQYQPNGNHRQQYRNSNDDNGRRDWRHDVGRSPAIYRRQLKIPSRFYFKKNYADIYGNVNSWSVDKGREWILRIRNASGGWGKETPRALIALSLVNNSFLAGTYENDLMQKFFQVHLGVHLLRNSHRSLNRLAMFVNALIATCKDPRDFQGQDLTEIIRSTIVELNRRSRPPFINPIVYLSLCLADRDLTHYEVHHLMTYLVAPTEDEATRDMTSLALEAFACYLQKERNAAHNHGLQNMIHNATYKILNRMNDDGSFGSVYSTALAAQALISVNDSGPWDPEKTFSFLKSHQLSNGSFGDFLATYYVLPALSGRSLLHLRNTRCNPPRIDRVLSPIEILQYPGPKQYIRYSLYLGSPLSTANTIEVLVPKGISFFDVMRVAEFQNKQFKFSFEEQSEKISVYSISEIPNDAEKDFAWRLYVRTNSHADQNTPNPRELFIGDIREFLPTADQHVIFWYHPIGDRY